MGGSQARIYSVKHNKEKEPGFTHIYRCAKTPKELIRSADDKLLTM